MVDIQILCSCNEIFSFPINLEDIQDDLEKNGIASVLIPHEDHFITAYIDKNLTVRSVEKVIIMRGRSATPIASKTSIEEEQVKSTVLEILKTVDPEKNHLGFLAQVAKHFTRPEEIFLAGKFTGFELWYRKREKIIKLGAEFTLGPEIVLTAELKPIYDKIAKTKYLKKEKTLVLQEIISPQFFIGIAQGVLDAIRQYANNPNITIKIDPTILERAIFLKLEM